MNMTLAMDAKQSLSQNEFRFKNPFFLEKMLTRAT
jgi:hypothetical protein